MEKQIETSEEPPKINKGPLIGKRHFQSILLFLCVTIELITRSSLSLSINAMTDNTTSINPDVPTYDWPDKNIVLSSFYWGYVVFQVLAGQLSKNYGARWLLFGAMACNSTALIFVPFAAKFGGSKAVMACRIAQGLAQGGLYPSCHTMLGRWSPKHERGQLSTFIYSGMYIATIIGLPITGLISRSYVGWPATCYLFGACGYTWCAIWFFFGYNNPSEHPSISSEEKNYIEESLNQNDNEEVIPTPWLEIFTSVQCWACLAGVVGAGFGIIFLQNELPTYLEKVMDYDVTSSGFLTSMTAVVSLVFNYIYGPLVDFVIAKKYVSQTNTRKLFTVIPAWGCAATMLGLAYMDKSHANISVVVLCVSSVFSAGVFVGPTINPVDLSPRFSGIILGWANSISMLVALTAPLFVQYIVTDETNATEWRTVFLIAAGMYIIPSAFFGIFASGERQWWDEGGKNVRNKKVSSDTPNESTINTTNEDV